MSASTATRGLASRPLSPTAPRRSTPSPLKCAPLKPNLLGESEWREIVDEVVARTWPAGPRVSTAAVHEQPSTTRCRPCSVCHETRLSARGSPRRTTLVKWTVEAAVPPDASPASTGRCGPTARRREPLFVHFLFNPSSPSSLPAAYPPPPPTGRQSVFSPLVGHNRTTVFVT